MQRAGLLATGTVIGVVDMALPATNGGASTVGGTNGQNGDAEPDRAAIERALAVAGGVVAQAATALGMSRQALYRRLERLGISRI